MRKKIAAGNWKMNGLTQDLSEIEKISKAQIQNSEVIICPPALLLPLVDKSRPISFGAQNAHAHDSGAYTGEISMPMIKNAGASHVIIGHSERREYFGETNKIVSEKANAAYRAKLVAIICVGETLEERESGRAREVVAQQIRGSLPLNASAQNTIIAYEPVWAIGTGKVPSNEDIAEMHAHIRSIIPDAAEMRVLYGGSVKGGNASEIFAIDNVDGGLVGGASLKADDFIPIIEANEKFS